MFLKFTLSLTVGEMTFIKDLKQEVKDVSMCLLDLIEKNHAVRLTLHLIGKQATFFKADILLVAHRPSVRLSVSP